MIGKIVLDHDFQSFKTQNEFVESLRKALSWMPDTQSFNPFHRKNPIRPLAFKYYKRRMDKYIGNVLDERFKVRDANLPKKARKKSGIDLALEAWFKESGQDVDSRTTTMDPEFRKSAIDNMLILLFAGHDTTASTLCYCYHMLSKDPDAQTKLRKELDDVFGVGVNAAEKLREDPYLINKCDYMAAVIKETLRLWAPGSTIRQGRKDHFLKHPDTGELLATEGMVSATTSSTNPLLIFILVDDMARPIRYPARPQTLGPGRQRLQARPLPRRECRQNHSQFLPAL